MPRPDRGRESTPTLGDHQQGEACLAPTPAAWTNRAKVWAQPCRRGAMNRALLPSRMNVNHTQQGLPRALQGVSDRLIVRHGVTFVPGRGEGLLTQAGTGGGYGGAVMDALER